MIRNASLELPAKSYVPNSEKYGEIDEYYRN